MTENVLNHVWPEWKVVRCIGEGSFGTVYEVVRQGYQMESHAAVKVISIPQNKSQIDSLCLEGMNQKATRTYLQNIVNDFVSEIRLMESFKGTQNIVSIEDYRVIEKKESVGWDIYIRMELLTPLSKYNITLQEKDVVKLGCDICSALELCAERNVIHRDIKPENIFVNDFGYFKLGDFGIARKLENVTGGLSQKGTYPYMAPEVEKGTQYDSTADIYSLGLVLYQFMNGNKLPFWPSDSRQCNPNERIRAVRRRLDGESLPQPSGASPALAEVILRACSPESKNRFPTAKAMKKALLSVANRMGNHEQSATDSLDKTISAHPPVHQPPVQSDDYIFSKQNFRNGEQRVIENFNQPAKSKASGIKIAAMFLTGLVLVGIIGVVIGKQMSKETVDSAKNVSDVYFERKDDKSDVEYAEITAVDEHNDTIWTYTTKEYPKAQLDGVNDIGIHGELYYMNDGGAIRAFRLQDGSEAWVNTEFKGSVTAKTFDENGILYLCGYFGPDLFIVDTAGNTIKRVESFDQNYFWPVNIKYYGEQVGITFENTPSEQEEEVFVNLNDYTTSIPQNTMPAPVVPSGPNASTTVLPSSTETDAAIVPSVSDVSIAETYASSYLSEPQYNIVHPPSNVLDGKNSTAWVEGADGQGVGESLVITFSQICKVSGFIINAGYQKNSDIYQKNCRPAQMTITFSNSSSLSVDLSDYNGAQQVIFDYPVETSSITFSINSVYAGNKYQDTAISEISFF